MRPVTAPMPDKGELYSDEREVPMEQAIEYAEIVGALVYYADSTMWHMACEVNRLAQRIKNPTVGAVKALDRLLAWLSGDYKTHQLRVPRVRGTQWHCWCDSDCGGDRVYGNKQSRSGNLLTANGMPSHWRSQKQASTAQSSTAAETIALSQAAQDSRLRLWIAEDMYADVKWPMEILVDNKGAISFQQKTNSGSKMRGIFDLREQWVKELKNKAEIKAVKVDTVYNVSDILTKPLAATVRLKLLEHLKTVQKNVIRRASI